MADSPQAQGKANDTTEMQPDPQFQKIWTAAISQFSASTAKRLDDPNTRRLGNIHNLQAEVERQHGQFSAYRAKRQNLFALMTIALKPVELFGAIFAAGTSLVFPPSSLIFGAVAYMIEAAKNVSASYDAICELFNQVQAYTTRLTVRLRQDIPKELVVIDTNLLCSLIQICGYTTRAIKHGRFRDYVSRIFDGKDEDVVAELENMNRLQIEQDRLILTFTHLFSVDSNKILQELQGKVNTIINARSQADARDIDDAAVELNRIKKTLIPTTASEDIYHAISKARLSGTAEWVQKEPLFQEWLAGMNPVICITGGPGAGKSYLASKIVEVLLKQHLQGVQNQNHISVAYFFCKDADHDLRSFFSVLKSIAYQICQNDADFAKHLAEICKFPDEIKTMSSLWQRAFESFYSNNTREGTVFVLIDGVDEGDDVERANFLRLINDVQKLKRTGGKARLRFLIIGRPEIGYEMEQLLQESVPMITISAGKNAADIEKFVKTKVRKERNFHRISSELRDEIQNTLIERADGMFLWVDLMLKEVAVEQREARMRDALQHMPKGLYKAMHRTFIKLSEELSINDAADLNTMLEWVTCSKRPLTLGELNDVLAITSEEGDGVVYLEGQLRKRYASIFTVNREDGRTTGELQMECLKRNLDTNFTFEATDAQEVATQEIITDDEFGGDMDIDSDPSNTEVTLAHNSFASFFRQETMTCKVRVNVNEAESKILKNLLNMICEGKKWKRYVNRSISFYAAEFWQVHLRAIDLARTSQQDIDQICQSMIRLFQNPNIAGRWAQQNRYLRNNWFYTEINNDRVHTWLSHAKLENGQAIWFQNLYPASAKEVTDQLVAQWGDEWLQSHNGAPDVFFSRIKAHNGMVHARQSGVDLPQPTDPEQSDMSNITAAKIISLARNFRYPEDGMWNIRVAMVLRTAGHHEEALEYFDKSVGQGEEPWRPWFGIARTRSKMKQPDSAIQAAQKCLEIFESDHKQIQLWGSMYRNALCFLGDLQANSGDNDGCLTTFSRVFGYYPNNFHVGTRVVGLLLFKSRITEAMQILEAAQQDRDAMTGASRLHKWVMSMIWSSQSERPLGEFYHVLVTVCRELNRREFAVEAYKGAIKVATRTGAGVVALLNNDLGNMLLREYRQTAEAEAMLQGVTNSSRNSRPGSASYHARRKACKVLCNIHVDRAITGGKDSQPAQEAIVKLASIWSSPHDTTDISKTPSARHPKAIPVSMHDSTLCLGVLYRHFGQTEQARKLFREHIRLALSMLTDEDPENDCKAYARLGKVLLKAGDDTGAIAARIWVSYRQKTKEKRPSVSNLSRLPSREGESAEKFIQTLRREDTVPIGRKNSTLLQELDLTLLDMGNSTFGKKDALINASSTTRTETITPYHWRCHGRVCNQREIAVVDGLYSCRFCLNVDFEESCYTLLMTDKLPFNVCSKNHQFLRHPVLTEPLPDGAMYVDGKYVPEKKWLEDLRKKWGLSGE